MSLLLQTSIISVMMIVLCCLPLFFHQVRKVSHFFFLAGTGALAGIICFDLMPDVMEMGGKTSVFLVLTVWAVYSIIHLMHYRHHQHDQEHVHTVDEDPLHIKAQGKKGIVVFLGSMIIHCVASGIMLAISSKISDTFSKAVFLALIAHKCYESLIVSSIILDQVKIRVNAIICIMVYSLSFPFGTLLVYAFNQEIGLKFAVLAKSLALGSLLGCMVFDFIIPSYHHIKERRIELLWVLLGLGMTELMMRGH